MLDSILAKVFGTKNERELKNMYPAVAAISEFEPAMQKLSDAELAAKTVQFKEQLDQGATLDDILHEAFAVAREAGRRVLEMRHYDVQLIGGVVLHSGKIAEMKTGEGKTLVATLPVYLNALSGKGVHVVTVNDYLAKRDSEWMGRLYKFLGLEVGVIVHDLSDAERKVAYGSDITYGTNNEFGFDYLRDNMKFRLEDCAQRAFNYAIVDEVDSILIDEARTPLIISGPSEESTDKYYRINGIIPKLVRGEEIDGNEPGEKFYTGDFTVDEKHRSVALTEEGALKVEKLLNRPGLFEGGDIESFTIRHHVEQALKAHVTFQRDRDYLVTDGQVVIVDEFTGRLMPGRRWSDGLHQAVEAKEGVKIERENQTLATITFQNYFRLYDKLAGMTGTAMTEEAEFGKTYELDVVEIPTNRDLVRIEHPDIVYRTEDEKWRNAAKEIAEFAENGRPVLVGTVSVEKSEVLSKYLKRIGVKHEVLNAKNHMHEAFIVSQAGRKGAVTVSTNMAGRGTDILLGGNPEYLAKEKLKKSGVNPDELSEEEWDAVYLPIKEETDHEHDDVVALGGLHIAGTERHESRRIDNQLRGRAGRQGDPGSSRFYLSLQDDLLRIFGGDRIQGLMLKLGMEEDVPIESGLITKRIAKAQEAVEAQHFGARKHLLEYDDVMNKQRGYIYKMRAELLEGKDMREKVMEMVHNIADSLMSTYVAENQKPHEWDFAALQTDVLTQFGTKIVPEELHDLTRPEILEVIISRLEQKYAEKEKQIPAEILRETERILMLNVIDNQWKDNLLSMDHLKEGIGLRGYGQKDPLIEYKKESFKLFNEMLDRIEDETIRILFFLQPAEPTTPVIRRVVPDDDGGGGELKGGISRQQKEAAENTVSDFTRNIQRKKQRELDQIQFVGGEKSSSNQEQVIRGKKVGRNDPCPCGSGKKYKKCCGK
jgi:preprotein translocase subunit SecA